MSSRHPLRQGGYVFLSTVTLAAIAIWLRT